MIATGSYIFQRYDEIKLTSLMGCHRPAFGFLIKNHQVTLILLRKADVMQNP
ncbi:hypothetical protein L579_4278 [Pantoea sp. AS-PWVM4]|nr:hypothetical protein L579_4278 [Pantoea sp. AS-PWVM4]